MKNLFHYSFILLIVIGISACNNHPDKKRTENKTIPEYRLRVYYKRLQSTEENHSAVLHLIKYQSTAPNKEAAGADRYRGIFVPDSAGAPLQVAGYVKADSTIQLIAYDHYSPVDTLTGRFTDGIFKGEKTDTSGKNTTFRFKETYPSGSYRWEVAIYTDSLTLDSASSNAPKATTDLMTLWPGKEMDSSAKERIEDSICLAFFGTNKRYPSADNLLKAVSDSFLQKYKKVTKDFLKKQGTLRPSFNWNAMAHTDITYNADGKISLLYTQYQYTGGAHGLQTTLSLVVSVKNNKVLSLSDVFKAGYEKPLQKALEAELRGQYDIPEKEPLNGEKGLLFDPHLPVSSNFYLTKDGIGFIYNPYEVAPYVVGEINLFLPYSRIKNLLK